MAGVDPASVAGEPERFLLDLAWASLRTGAALALMPGLGGVSIPVQVRIGLAATVGVFLLAGGTTPPRPADLLSLSGALAVAGELAIGLTLALALHAAFGAAAIAGEWIAQGMGLTFALAVSPDSGQSSVLSLLFALLLWMVFLAAGGHLLLLSVLVESYATMPSAAALLEPARLSAVIAWGGFAIASGLIAALPLGGALLLLNIVLAVAAKSAPQLNLFAVGFPLMLLVGLVGLPLALPGMGQALGSTLLELQRDAAGVILGR
ncbi:flagellar biosynthetic protein FliR [Thermaurantiacus sp.]